MSTSWSLKLSDYSVDEKHGFLPRIVCTRLPAEAFDAFECLMLQIPSRLAARRVRRSIRRLPSFPVELLSGRQEVHRALLILAILAHSYVFGEDEICDILPAVISVPLCKVAELIGVPPTISHASLVLFNWVKLETELPIQADNLAILNGFYGGPDEHWFYMITVEMEAVGGAAAGPIVASIRDVAEGNAEPLLRRLKEIENIIKSTTAVLSRMPERNDPYIFYHRVRPFINGWKDNANLANGLLYEGCYDGRRQFFRGASGAQSSLIPMFDVFLGVQHHSPDNEEFLQEMREYIPQCHREFLQRLSSAPSLRNFVASFSSESGSTALLTAFNSCLTALQELRALHLQLVARYIVSQSRKERETGTGGSELIPFLKATLKEVTEALVYQRL